MRPLLRGVAAVTLMCATQAGDAAARPRVQPKPPGDPATTVEALVVQPKLKCLQAKREPNAVAPKVVSSYPKEGDVVRPGWLVVRLTFNQPMTCSGYMNEIAPFPRPCALGTQHLVLSPNRRTLRTICAVEPNTGYALRLSEDDNAVVSLYGEKAERFDLTFRTSTDRPVTTISEALDQDTAIPPQDRPRVSKR